MNALPLVGDCRSIPLPDGSVDAVVTDPPYGLSFMGKSWDHDVPGPDYWREVYRVMKPGAHLLAWAIPRKAHHLGQALEASGFEIRDKLMHLFGTGFPKSHRFSAKMNGDKSERWEGWGTALRPGYEEIWLAMKPTDGTFAGNALTHGVAGLNVDGCRIGTEGGRTNHTRKKEGTGKGWHPEPTGETTEHGGRWPANVTLSHTRWCRRRGTKRVEADQMGSSGGDPDGHGIYNEGFPRGDGRKQDYADEDGTEEVEDWDCPPSCPVRQLDEQSGHLPGPANKNPSPKQGVTGVTEFTSGGEDRLDYIVDRDGGGASRFYYCAKASRSEREAGLPDVEGRANSHPTVKPIDLCRWLVRLVTRKGHLVLDPFMGSGSIGCAALQERRRYIGLDLEPEYVEIARARLEHWAPKQVDMFRDTA